jgi:subtilisin family serine protease
LWAVKVLDSGGSGYLSDLIAGVDWVTAHASTIEVGNMSLMATAKSDIFRKAIQNSVAAGVVHVVAAGNNGGDIFGRDGVFNTSDDAIPAAYPEVATISALADSDGKPGGLGAATNYGADDSFASFSSYSASIAPGNPVNSPGAGIDLLMPGVNIYSCWMNGGYRLASGTSMASPHATGLAALYIAEHGRASNAAGVYAIRQALIDAGQNQDGGMRLAHPETERDRYLENLGWAGQADSGDGAPMVAIVRPTDGSTVAGTVTIQVRATDPEDSADRLTVRVSIDGAAARTANYNSSSGYHELAWNTTTVSDGQHGITASATDSAGHTSSTAQVRVSVANSGGVPTAVIVNPPNGSVVSGAVTIQVEASATDDGPVTAQVSIDGASAQNAQYNGVTGYYERGWDTKLAANGSHTIDARAIDGGGHSTSAARVTVTVSNVVAQPTMHVASVSVRIISLGSGWQRTRANVIVVDDVGMPVGQAVVTGTFSGEVSEGAKMRITDTSGLAVFETVSLASRPLRITFCVNNITHARYKYQPSDNRESCDSTY